jgi:ABC-type antimicrobial peptide transport system permease subunit
MGTRPSVYDFWASNSIHAGDVIYGAMAYAVARRTGEIGIRTALGAQTRGIIWMVLREVLAISTAGLLLGYGAARLTTRFVESFLFPARTHGKADQGGAGAVTGIASRVR